MRRDLECQTFCSFIFKCLYEELFKGKNIHHYVYSKLNALLFKTNMKSCIGSKLHIFDSFCYFFESIILLLIYCYTVKRT